MPDFKENMFWVSLGLGLKALAATLVRIAKKDPWLGRALKDFNGVYCFENGDGTLRRYLVFRGGGKVAAAKRLASDPDFTVTLREPKAFRTSRKPEDVLKMVISNKIAQSGNTHYMYQFGFVMSLLQRYFRDKRKTSGTPLLNLDSRLMISD